MNLLLVDDEDSTREGLRNFIPWERLGIESVNTARNGVEAMDLADHMKPDILLTDVRMPKMDGIELATRIHQLFPHCKIIFLSGYCDKEYLLTAIKLNVVRYVEKPIVMDEITEAISESVRLTNSEQERGFVLKQNLALFLATGSSFPDNLDLISIYSDLIQLEAASYCSLTVQFLWNSEVAAGEKDQLKTKILAYMDNYPSVEVFVVAGFTESQIMAVHLLANEDLHPARLSAVAAQLEEQLQALIDFNASIWIGVGTSVSHPKELAASYRTALSALTRRFFAGRNHILHYNETSAVLIFHVEESSFDQFACHIEEGDCEETMSFLTGLRLHFEHAPSSGEPSIKNVYFKLYSMMYSCAEKKGISLFKERGQTEYIWETLSKMPTLAELSDFMIRCAADLLAILEEKDNYGSIVYRVMKYIQTHSEVKDLTIKRIADELHFSQYYLCSLFKKKSGKTMNDYITEVRLDKAMELLKDKKMKLYEVADMVGYNDVKHFTKIFKKYTSCSPSEYREKRYL